MLIFSLVSVSILAAVIFTSSEGYYAFAQTEIQRTTELKVKFDVLVERGNDQNIRVKVNDVGSGDPVSAHGQVPQDAVGDPQHARDLVQRLGRAGEQEQVVEALGLVVDLVRKLAPAPDVMAVPASVALDGLADARDDLVLPVLGRVRVEQQQNFVLGHGSRSAPFGLVGSAGSSPLGWHGEQAEQEVGP